MKSLVLRMAFPRSLHELVVGPAHEPARKALAPFYRLRRTAALSRLPPPVAQKYGKEGSEQHVITVTDRLLHRQTCWNPQRGNKPQNFVSRSSSGVGGGGGGSAAERLHHHALDPLLRPGGGKTCDFCAPLESTAEDVPFGRVAARGRAVSASNLFKCAAPCHGVIVLTRQHDPLAFSRRDVAALLECAEGWFSQANAAAAAVGGAPPPRLHPFLLWNALPRAGASQFHGHAQTALTLDAVPEQGKLWRAERAFAGEAGRGGGGSSSGGSKRRRRCYYSSLVRAKEAAGLLRVVTCPSSASSASLSSLSSLSSMASVAGRDEDDAAAAPSSSVAYVFASLAPVKDAELVVVVPAETGPGGGGGGGGGATENSGGNLSALRSPALGRALHAALRAVVDGVGGGSGAFNAGVHNLEVGSWRGREEGDDEDDDDDDAPPPWDGGGGESGESDDPSSPPPPLFPGGRPIVARVVSRGPPSAVASDFGALEVMGGASIGHTDPYSLMALFDAALEAADKREEKEGEEEEEEDEAEMATTASTSTAAAAGEEEEKEGRKPLALL